MVIGLIKKLFKKNTTDTKEDNFIQQSLYPPQKKGVPSIPIELILEHEDIKLQIQELRTKSQIKITNIEFETHIMPMIKNLVLYIHLLPASELHHHRGNGGLLCHLLEVAKNTALACNHIILNNYKSTSDKRSNENLCWFISLIASSLMHDIGKIIFDIEISAKKEGKFLIWHPITSKPLSQWLKENAIDSYQINFNKGRKHNEHEKYSLFFMDKIIPQETRELLRNSDGSLQFLMDMLTKNRTEIPDYERIIKNSDQESVKNDVNQFAGRLVSDSSNQLSFEQVFFDAIKNYKNLLPQPNQEYLNSDHSLFLKFQSSDGIYINHKNAYSVFREYTNQIGYTNFPKSTSDWKNKLFEMNIIIAKDEKSREYEFVIGDEIIEYCKFSSALWRSKLKQSSKKCPISLDGKVVVFGTPKPKTLTKENKGQEINQQNIVQDANVIQPNPVETKDLKTNPIEQSNQKSSDNQQEEQQTVEINKLLFSNEKPLPKDLVNEILKSEYYFQDQTLYVIQTEKTNKNVFAKNVSFLETYNSKMIHEGKGKKFYKVGPVNLFKNATSTKKIEPKKDATGEKLNNHHIVDKNGVVAEKKIKSKIEDQIDLILVAMGETKIQFLMEILLRNGYEATQEQIIKIARDNENYTYHSKKETLIKNGL